MYRMPHKCPICEGKLTVTQLSCPTCGSRLEGEFSGCRFCELSQEESRFLLTFIKNRGSIKDVEREMGVSYPTVRAALDGLIASLRLSTPDAPCLLYTFPSPRDRQKARMPSSACKKKIKI